MRSRIGITLIAPFLAATAASDHTVPGEVKKDTGEGVGACPTGYLCLYVNAQFNQGAPDLILKTNQDIPDLTSYQFDNVTTSLYNNSNKIWEAWTDKNYRGAEVTLNPQDVTDLAGTPWDNTISSVRFQ